MVQKFKLVEKNLQHAKKLLLKMESNRSNQNCNVNVNHMFKCFNFPAMHCDHITGMWCVIVLHFVLKSKKVQFWEVAHFTAKSKNNVLFEFFERSSSEGAWGKWRKNLKEKLIFFSLWATTSTQIFHYFSNFRALIAILSIYWLLSKNLFLPSLIISFI